MKQTMKSPSCLQVARIPRTITLALALLVLTAACNKQEAPRNSQVVDGVAIHLGVVPSRNDRGDPGRHAEPTMHSPVPAAGRSDHVVVALFEDSTGKRIEDAQVIGSITEITMGSDRKTFQRMRINGTITYGSYMFNMPPGRDYHLKLWIRRPGNQKAIEATFSNVSLGS
jgi:hypothetical protein